MLRQANRPLPDSLTTAPSPIPSFFPPDLLNALGLSGAHYQKNLVPPKAVFSRLRLGDGAWDERTGGGRGVQAVIDIDAKDRLRRFKLLYACLPPSSGDARVIDLIEMETAIQKDKLRVARLRVLGEEINVGSAEHVARVMGALRTIHADLRNLAFPEVAKILHDFQVDAVLGRTALPADGREPLDIPGSSYRGGTTFWVAVSPNATTEPQIPSEFVPEMLGFGRNDLDNHYRFTEEQTQIGTHPDTGAMFKLAAKLVCAHNGGTYRATVTPMTAQGPAIPDFIDMSWRNADKGEDETPQTLIETTSLLGDDSVLPSKAARRLGAINLINKDLRQGRYPATPDHLARYNLQDLIDSRSFATQLDNQVKMFVVPFSGHNDREYLPGFGGTIGGNCKGIFACWADTEQRARRKGILIDMGVTFKKSNGIQTGAHGNWDYVVPDVSGVIDDIDDIFITHVHADHMMGLVDLATCGLATGKTVHASIYSCRVLRNFLKKAKVPRDQWPTLNALSGNGWVHLSKDNRRVMSVHYSVNAIPHSTEVTAFAVMPAPYICDAQGIKTEAEAKPNPHYFSYASLGDMCFGPYNLKNYEGEKPLDTGFKPDFFSIFKSGAKAHYPDTPASMRARLNRIDVVELDPTSIHRDGFAPDVVTGKRNWMRVMNEWFPDKDMVVPSLSTSKRAHEMFLGLAVETNRDISTDGAYLEDRWTDMSVGGVNPDVLAAQGRGNIQAYIDFYAAKAGKEAVRYMRRTAKTWLEIMRDSTRRKIVLTTGSQGSEIEKHSVGTQIANGWSRWQLDPKYFRSAYGTDPKGSIVVYQQGAIPGNEETQLAQIRKTAYENDMTVVASVHNGTRFFNLKEPHRSRILADMEQRGDTYTAGENGDLFVHRFSLYVPGHGWREDYRQGFMPWLKENNVKSIWVQHFAQYESVRTAYALADEIKLKHPTDSTPNHAVCTLENGTAFTIVGQLTPSFIFARTNRRADKYHGGTTEYLRAVFRSGDGGRDQDGLFAQANNTVYFSTFGQGDLEQGKRDQLRAPVRSRRSPDKATTRQPPPMGINLQKPIRGISAPMAPRHHAYFGIQPKGLNNVHFPV